jgi:hypothetical protein
MPYPANANAFGASNNIKKRYKLGSSSMQKRIYLGIIEDCVLEKYI